MKARLICSFYLFFSLITTASAQDKEELRKPLETVLKSMAWSSVLSRNHDVTATVHFGSNDDNEGGPVPSSSVEGICKSRQIYDSKTGDYWIPYARGAFALRFDSKQVEPLDMRYVGVFSGDNDNGKEISLNGRPTKTIRGAKDPLRASNPIDILFVTTNPYAQSHFVSKQQITDYDIALARLDSLDLNQLRVTEEMLDKRKVVVFRVKAIPIPKSKSIAVNKIVVSAEGVDKGLVIQFSRDSMKLDDKSPYENDQQLLGDHSKSQRIHWKEFRVDSANQTKETLVLPVSISTKNKTPHGGGYMNATLEWNSFATPTKDIRSIEACKKIAHEFDEQINKALNR